ncbi:MAG: MBL fold metallo-hydrolase [Candidatus Rifleibacteriota bacterium]
MLGINFIGSGSKGNSALLEFNNSYFLLDAGFSCKKIKDFLSSRNLEVSDLSGIFITHEHEDHAKGLKVLLKRFPDLPVYASGGTLSALRDRGVQIKSSIRIKPGNEIELAKVRCFPFNVPHDAQEPVGMRFEFEGRVLAIATDVGHLSSEVFTNLIDANLLCIESNYDEQMLKESIYPAWLKNRIRSKKGHLPNEGFRGILSRMKKDPEILVLMHLSQESNTNWLVRDVVHNYFELNPKRFKKTRVSIEAQNKVGERLLIESGLSSKIKNKILLQPTFDDFCSFSSRGLLK